ncbi:unnamed protein product [Bursaphelenchus xylophilus]|uniref:(pine wood nematode) hypothetical protein n=1 Tax=Bursaphelenchus xylophilus TaxID=6326 RepID=A0A1I7RY69_BURXY|nr:unnamed protein product [Bursaphelenchus xylophilus]CAG9085364.1 unnamed protein product [Bursaphelenchus xylophilus]
MARSPTEFGFEPGEVNTVSARVGVHMCKFIFHALYEDPNETKWRIGGDLAEEDPKSYVLYTWFWWFTKDSPQYEDGITVRT